MLSSGSAQVSVTIGVYPPQHDSNLLISAMRQCIEIAGRSVLDVCTGSGVIAIAAAQCAARSVAAFDICPDAVRCARANALAAGVPVEIKRGDHAAAAATGPFDVVLANPPYVPTVSGADDLPEDLGPPWAWDAGPDGRMVLDSLCDSAPDMLTDGGTMLLVQSELADPQESLRRLSDAGLTADIVAVQYIPFGPVLTARSRALERAGLIPVGKRVEELVVIRAERA